MSQTTRGAGSSRSMTPCSTSATCWPLPWPPRWYPPMAATATYCCSPPPSTSSPRSCTPSSWVRGGEEWDLQSGPGAEGPRGGVGDSDDSRPGRPVVFEYFGGIGVRFTVGTAYQDGAELVFDHPVRRHH